MQGKYLIYLMCHGEAVYADAETGDYNRSLTPEGVRQIQAKADEFRKKALIRPDCILCSTARRATETAGLLSELFKGTPCFYRDTLYLAPAFRILDLLKEMDYLFRRIMIIGHRYGLEQLAALLSEHTGDIKIHYGQCLCIRLKMKNWQSVGVGIGKIIS